MPKRGTFLPYRVAYRYPAGPSGRKPLHNLHEAAWLTAELLRRGADVDMIKVDEHTRRDTILHSFTPDDMPEDDEPSTARDAHHIEKKITEGRS